MSTTTTATPERTEEATPSFPTDELPTDDFKVDDNVLAGFPEGTEVLYAAPFGTSAWTATAKLHLRLPSGLEERYFLKCAPKDHGRVLLEGEFNSMLELYKWAPYLVPKPHSCGKLAQGDPETYFFLSEYIEMHANRMPDPDQLCKKLARLHNESQSPTGMFGFHTTTCQGRSPQHVAWERSWTTFENLLQHAIAMDFELDGYWEAVDTVEKRLISFVMYSVSHLSQGTAVRQIAFDDMYYLIDKFAPFPDGAGPLRLVACRRDR